MLLSYYRGIVEIVGAFVSPLSRRRISIAGVALFFTGNLARMILRIAKSALYGRSMETILTRGIYRPRTSQRCLLRLFSSPFIQVDRIAANCSKCVALTCVARCKGDRPLILLTGCFG